MSKLEEFIPRCETTDINDFSGEHLDDSERCWNCLVWEKIDEEVKRARIDEWHIAHFGVSDVAKEEMDFAKKVLLKPSEIDRLAELKGQDE